jgi:hypothetical protein
MSLKDAHFHQALTVDGTLAGTPLADQFDSGIKSDVVCMSKYNKAYFIMYWGTSTGGTGVETLTVVPCATAAGSTTTTAIPFRYKHITVPDTNAAWVAASTVNTSAVASGMCIVEVNAEDLPLVSGVKYEYCYLNIAETTNGAKLGGVIIIMDEPRYAQDTSETVTA